jgi:hypothetical protein
MKAYWKLGACVTGIIIISAALIMHMKTKNDAHFDW